MTPKKSEKSNLEKKTTLFFQMGLVVAMAGLLVAFESGTGYLDNTMVTIDSTPFEDTDITQVTRPEVEKPKPPVVIEEIVVIEDELPDVEIPDDAFLSDIDVNGAIDLYFIEEDDDVVDDVPFVRVEQMPSYMGGDENKFQKHLQQLVVYPTQAIELGIQGRVLVNFVIDRQGKLTRATIFRSPDELLSNAVIEAIGQTKKWKPGEQRNIKVPVQFTIPVYFKLQ